MTTRLLPEAVPTDETRQTPFVGLEPFQEGDAPYFFGRERDQRIITANLRGARLTLLYGASGAGKSSVLQAGVVHQLRLRVAEEAARQAKSGRDQDTAPFAVTYFNSWRDPNPLKRLIDQLRAAVMEASPGVEFARWEPGEPIADVLRQWTDHVRSLLVVLDQFEEYFLYHVDGETDDSFAVEFPKLVNDPSLRANFLVSIREDAWAKLDLFKGKIPDLFSNYLRLNHLDHEAARRAIDCPIDVFNESLPETDHFSIEPELTEAVLDGVTTSDLSIAQTEDKEVGAGRSVLMAERHIEPAFLQLVMHRLWEVTEEEGERVLRKETLAALGGPHEIVRSHLERSLSELSADERAIVADVFRFLVTSAKTKVAQRVTDLAYWTERSESEVLPVLERLATGRRGRILRPLPPPLGEKGARFEIFHDVLAEAILDWRRRYERERATMRLAERLRKDRQRREEAEQERHQAQVNRLVRWSALGLAVLAAALVGAVIYALEQRQAAHSRGLAASADSQLDVDPELSLLLAREAWEEKDTPEAEAALRRALGASRVRGLIPVGTGLSRALWSPDRKLIATVAEDGHVQFWRAADSEEVKPGVAAGWEVNDVAFSRDGGTVIVAGAGGALLQRLRPGARAVRFEGRGPVNAISMSADGRYVATADMSGVSVWSVSAGDLPTVTHRKRLGLPYPLEVHDVEFNPRNSKSLVAATKEDDSVRLWSWPSGRAFVLRGLGPFTHPTGDISYRGILATFSPDGTRVATSVRAADARVWDAQSRELLRELPGTGRGVNALAWSPDSRLLAAAAGNEGRIYSVGSRAPGVTLKGHSDLIQTLDFSPDASRLVTASRDGSALVWDARSGLSLAELRGHTSNVASAEFPSRGSRVVTAGGDGTARIWDTDTGRELRGHSDWVLAAAFSPDGRLVATAAEDGSARIWSLHGRDQMRTIATELDVGRATDIEFDADGRRVLVAGTRETNEGRIFIADAETGEVRSTLKTGGVTDAAFSPDGKRILVSNESGAPELWDLKSRKRIRVLDYPTRGGQVDPGRVDFSPDGGTIAVGGTDGVARVFATRTGKLSASFAGHEGVVVGASFSEDGNRVVSYGFDRTARIWHPGDSEGVTLRGHTGWVTSAAFDARGERVVTASTDKTVRVWDAETGKPLGVMRPHGDAINSVAVSPDGRTFLTASNDTTAKLTRCETCVPAEALLAVAARRVTRGLTDVERQDFVQD